MYTFEQRHTKVIEEPTNQQYINNTIRYYKYI